MLRNPLANALLASIKSVQQFALFPQRFFSTGTAHPSIHAHAKLDAEQEKRAQENAAIMDATKKIQLSRDMLIQLLEMQAIPAKFEQQARLLIQQQPASLQGEYEQLTQFRTTIIHELQQLLSFLNDNLQRKLARSEFLDKKIDALTAALDAASNEKKQLTQQEMKFKESHYLPGKNYEKENDLLIDEAFKLQETCDLLTAIQQAATAEGKTISAIAHQGQMTQLLDEHAAGAYENVRLQLWVKARFVAQGTKELCTLLEDRQLLTNKVKVLKQEIAATEQQLDKLISQAGQLKELIQLSAKSLQVQPLVESQEPNIVRLSKI